MITAKRITEIANELSDTNDLNEVIRVWKIFHSMARREKANTFHVGQKVAWDDSRNRGAVINGVIEKINRKYIVVKEDAECTIFAARWNIDPALLRAI